MKKILFKLSFCLIYVAVLSTAVFSADEIVVNINVEDHSGFEREAWPVTGGIPLPKGKVSDISTVGLLNTPSQTRVLSRWSDGSIKWVLFDYQTDLAANGQAKHAVIISDNLTSVAGNSVTETSSGITVDTGALKFTVSKNSFSLIYEAFLDVNKDGDYGDNGENIISPDTGQRHFFDTQNTSPARPAFTYRARNLKTGESHPVANSTPTQSGGPIWMRPEGGGSETSYIAGAELYSAIVRETGPLRTVIEIKGRFPSTTENNWEGNTYSIWIHAYHGKSYVRVQHNFLLKGDPRTDYIRRIGLQLPMNFLSQPAFDAAGQSAPKTLSASDTGYLYNSGPDDVFHLYHNGFKLPWEAHAGSQVTTGEDKTDGWIDLSTSVFGVTAIIKDMAYMYPKELSYNAGSKVLTSWLWPDHGNLVMDMNATGWTNDDGKQGMQGVSFSHDMLYHFHSPSPGVTRTALAGAFNNPLQPYANPEWYSYRGTRAAGMIMPRDDDNYPKTEGYLATGTALIERSMKEFGWLGMLNYGDIMQDFSYNEDSSATLGTWGLADRTDDYGGWRHGNTMLSYRMFMEYLRTGEYHYFTAVDAHLKHVRDVLIKHYNEFRDQDPDEMQWTGMGRRHSAYWGAGTDIDQHGGVAVEGYGTNWLGHYLHWNLTGDWRTYDVINEIRSAFNEFGSNTWVTELSGAAFVGLKLMGGIPGYENSVSDADLYKSLAISKAEGLTDEWRDCTWFFGYGVYLQDYTPDTAIKQALTDFGGLNPGQDQWGLFWNRDSLSAAYWAAEGNQTLRDTIYQTLLQNSTEQASSVPSQTLVSRQWSLLSQYDTSGLFTCDITDLASAVCDLRYWRIKDDMIQLQWDEPLSMAVIDHYQNGFPQDSSPQLAITSPSDNVSVQIADNPISFTASSTDPEGGDISSKIIWTSSLDGVFLSPFSLSEGTHTIIASVTDSGGLTASDSISVTVSLSKVDDTTSPGDDSIGGEDSANTNSSGGGGGCFIETVL